MTHPPSSRREEQKTEDVQLSKVNVKSIIDGRVPSMKINEHVQNKIIIESMVIFLFLLIIVDIMIFDGPKVLLALVLTR